MTGLERIRAAVAHRPADVVPWHPYVSPGHALHLLGHETHEMVTVPGLLPRAMIHACKHYGSDMVYARGDLSMAGRYDIETRPDGVVFHDRGTGRPVYRVERDMHNLIPLGDREDASAQIEDISEVEEKMPITSGEVMIEGPDLDPIRLYKEELGDSVAVFGCAVGVTIKALRHHRGFERGLMDLWLNQDLAEAIMWRREYTGPR
jgi:hypothetical protein